MSNNRIKFFSYRGCSDPNRRRSNSPAADSKIDYIISVLNRCGYSVDHVSKASSSITKSIPFYVEKKGENTYTYFATFRCTRSLFRILGRWFLDCQFFVWCMLNLKRDEAIIVYHSLGFASTFIKLKRIKNIHIIGEIEEIYQDVHRQSRKKKTDEYKFINLCDKYIFPTLLLDKKVNLYGKPSVIVHGLYSIENKLENKFNDGLIHVVYGGTLDPEKGGAAAAAAAAAHLPGNYHVHICGFGDSIEIRHLISQIQKTAVARLTFEGELNGDDYKCFIQKCHIGLSTQNPHAAFNETSFPSKILVYLSNGLKVVSIRIPAIMYSAVADSVYFYDKQTPQEIAKAIQAVYIADVDGPNVLLGLDKKFEVELERLLTSK